MRAPFVSVGAKYFVWIACMMRVGFVVQISPRAIRIDGHPWEQVPSGSTTHPSEQQAGEVASNRALRAKASRLSGVSEKPSFSRASVALIRYGLWDLTFIICKGINCPQNPRVTPWILRRIQAIKEGMLMK